MYGGRGALCYLLCCSASFSVPEYDHGGALLLRFTEVFFFAFNTFKCGLGMVENE